VTRTTSILRGNLSFFG